MMTFNAAFPVQNHPFPHQLELGMKKVCYDLKAFVIKKKKIKFLSHKGKSKAFQSFIEIMRGMELLILFPQQMSQHVNQQASNVIINTEQENSDFLTVPSLLMPLLPNRLFKIPHATPIFPSVTHFLQESNLFLSSPDILKAFPAGPAQVSRLQRSLGCSKDWICANFFSTLVSPEQHQTGHI